MKSTEFEKKRDAKINNPRHANKKPKMAIKSKHKHEYIEVLLLLIRKHPIYSHQTEEKAYRTRICPICGKIQLLDMMEEMKRNGGHFFISLDRKEMLERYPDHLVFDLGDHVYKHYYDLDGQDYIDIRAMYRNDIESILSSECKISEDDITYGLLNNVKPDRMAIRISQKRYLEENIDKGEEA